MTRNNNPPGIYLLSSWDYRHKQMHPAKISMSKNIPMSCTCLIDWLYFENAPESLTVILFISYPICRSGAFCQYHWPFNTNSKPIVVGTSRILQSVCQGCHQTQVWVLRNLGFKESFALSNFDERSREKLFGGGGIQSDELEPSI
jgi:hypothetical protein